MRKYVMAGLLLVTAACASRKELEKAQTEAQALAAEKDSLLSEVLATTKLVSDVNGELAKARGVGVSPTTPSENPTATAAEDRQILLGKIREVVARLNESEAQLERSKKRLSQLAAKDAKLTRQIEDFQRQVTELRTSVEQQQALIEQQSGTITAQKITIDSLGVVLDTVSTQNRQLSDSVAVVTTAVNTVYLAVGPKDSLKMQGVVVDEGSKFLFFGGKQTVPARNLDPAAFTMLNRQSDRTLSLPEGHTYKIVSRHDARLLEPAPVDGAKIQGGTVTITNPDAFWAPSKYLIIVQQ